MQTKANNKSKKEYLRSYLHLRRREIELAQELEAIRSEYIGRAIQYSDMPKAPYRESDLSDYIVKIEALSTKLKARQNEAIERYNEIEDAIEELEDVRERQLLRVRYIQGVTNWDTIGELIGYSRIHAIRLHGTALEHFILPSKR